MHPRRSAGARRILPFSFEPARRSRSDQPCETAIERDTGGFGRCPDRSDRSRRPARHAGAVRTAPCQGVSLRASARAGRTDRGRPHQRGFSRCVASGWQVQKADPPFPPGCWRLRGSRPCLRCGAGRTSELDDEAANAIEDTSDDPEVAVQKKDTSEALRKCLTALSPEHREIVDLVYYHEKSVEEVAEIVGIPENTVKTRLFYARKKLAELLKSSRHGARLAMMASEQENAGSRAQRSRNAVAMACGRHAERARCAPRR